jgi:purine-binding chemotaxis protein CheW
MASTPHVIFRLGPQPFAIALASVKDVARAPEVTAVPEAPAAIRGLIVNREQLTVVIDVRTRLGLKTTDKPGSVLVVEHAGERVALLVDRMEEVTSLPVSAAQAELRDPLWEGVVAGMVHRAADTLIVLSVPALVEGAAAAFPSA